MDDVSLTMRLCAYIGRIPGWHWSAAPGAQYPDDGVGIHYGDIPDAPDRAIGVRLYGIPRDDVSTERIRRVQFRIRGARRDRSGADSIGSTLRLILTRVLRMDGISEITFSSMSPLGADKNGREERTENYLITLDNPEAYTS